MRERRTTRQQAIDGAKCAAKLLLGFAVFLCFVGGVLGFIDPERSRLVGALLLAIAIVASAYWIDSWRKWFPGVFAFGFWPSLVAIVTGHVRHGRTIDRLAAADYFLFFVLGSILSLPYAKKKQLTLIDKGALLLAAVAFAIAVSTESVRMLIPLPLVLLIPLLVQAVPRRRRKLMAQG